jgi:hypothetical protein
MFTADNQNAHKQTKTLNRNVQTVSYAFTVVINQRASEQTTTIQKTRVFHLSRIFFRTDQYVVNYGNATLSKKSILKQNKNQQDDFLSGSALNSKDLAKHPAVSQSGRRRNATKSHPCCDTPQDLSASNSIFTKDEVKPKASSQPNKSGEKKERQQTDGSFELTSMVNTFVAEINLFLPQQTSSIVREETQLSHAFCAEQTIESLCAKYSCLHLWKIE